MRPLNTLTKQQLFDLQIKYSNIVPKNGSGKVIKNWWYDEYAWLNVCLNFKLSNDFLRDFKDYLVWSAISYYQSLSEDTIREFKDYVIWKTIVRQQYLSPKFIDEMISEGYIKDYMLR